MALPTQISEVGKFVTDLDYLELRAFSSRNCTLEYSGEVVIEDGVRVFQQTQQVLTGDRLLKTGTHKLPVGLLTHWQCRIFTGSVRVGQVFVKANLVRVANEIRTRRAVLFSGYPDQSTDLVFPWGSLQPSLSGFGALRNVIGTMPAPGAEIVEISPTNAHWRVVGFRATLTTSADVADREVTLQTGALFGDKLIIPSPLVQKKSEVRMYHWMVNAPNYVGVGNHHVIFFPEYPGLAQQVTLQTHTEGLQALDEWSDVEINAREWIEI